MSDDFHNPALSKLLQRVQHTGASEYMSGLNIWTGCAVILVGACIWRILRLLWVTLLTVPSYVVSVDYNWP